jgi:uncharacterized protein
MANVEGDFIWYELMTTDTDAAADFYGAVVGWAIDRQATSAGATYPRLSAGETMIGGLFALDEAMLKAGARPNWMGYIAVEDVDAKAAAIKAAGGHIHVPPTDIPGYGRFAMCADPSGAPFYIMHGSVEGESRSFAAKSVGHCAWNELSTPDQASAHAFYTGLFGWAQNGAMDMGPMGQYCFLEQGGTQIGATTPLVGEAPPHWRYYFRVADIAAVAEAIPAQGGTLLHGPEDVPGDDRILIAMDPQGAVFALVGAA